MCIETYFISFFFIAGYKLFLSVQCYVLFASEGTFFLWKQTTLCWQIKWIKKRFSNAQIRELIDISAISRHLYCACFFLFLFNNNVLVFRFCERLSHIVFLKSTSDVYNISRAHKIFFFLRNRTDASFIFQDTDVWGSEWRRIGEFIYIFISDRPAYLILKLRWTKAHVSSVLQKK